MPTLETNYFDLLEGIFSAIPNPTCLNEEETNLLKKLLMLKLDNNVNSFSSAQRQALLKIIINYYILNVEGFKKPKSLDVFKEVFS